MLARAQPREDTKSMDSSADGGHPFAEYTDRQLRKWLIQHGGLPRGVGYRAGLVKVAMERLNSGDGAGKEVPVAVTPQQSRRSKPDHRANTEYLVRSIRSLFNGVVLMA